MLKILTFAQGFVQEQDTAICKVVENETLTGMILFYHSSFPKQNDIVRIGNIVVKVRKVTATRLDLVNVKIEFGILQPTFM